MTQWNALVPWRRGRARLAGSWVLSRSVVDAENASYLSVGFFMALLHGVFQLLLLAYRPLELIVGLPKHGLQLLHLSRTKDNINIYYL